MTDLEFMIKALKLQLSSHLAGTLGSPSQFTHVCAGLSPPLNVESNRSWCWQSLLSTLGGGTATSVPTNVTTIVAWIPRLFRTGHKNWKTVPEYFLRRYGGLELLLNCNYNVKLIENLPNFY